jgi:hypothetical protein
MCTEVEVLLDALVKYIVTKLNGTHGEYTNGDDMNAHQVRARVRREAYNHRHQRAGQARANNPAAVDAVPAIPVVAEVNPEEEDNDEFVEETIFIRGEWPLPLRIFSLLCTLYHFIIVTLQVLLLPVLSPQQRVQLLLIGVQLRRELMRISAGNFFNNTSAFTENVIYEPIVDSACLYLPGRIKLNLPRTCGYNYFSKVQVNMKLVKVLRKQYGGAGVGKYMYNNLVHALKKYDPVQSSVASTFFLNELESYKARADIIGVPVRTQGLFPTK